MRASFKGQDFGGIARTFPALVQSNSMKFTEILKGGQGKVRNMLPHSYPRLVQSKLILE
jgi:hypothetical protein